MIRIIFILLTSAFLVACGSSGKKSDEMADKTAPQKEEPKAETETTAETPEADASTVTCMLAKDNRTITVVPQDKGCELQYTKFGETKTVATSAYNTDHCEKVQMRMKDRLSNAGFKCE